MTHHDATQTLNLDAGAQAWAALTNCVHEFEKGWRQQTDPPELRSYLPDGPDAQKRLVLAELVKVDLKHRQERVGLSKPLDSYVAEFPELLEEGVPPCDVVLEEYRLRKFANQQVSISDYCAKYPSLAIALKRLAGSQEHLGATTLVGQQPAEQILVGGSIDDFDLLLMLGNGAFGQVYLARQKSMQRMVALKISADRGDEPRTMAQLDHGNIVRVFDARVLPERKMRLLYMQYIPGGTLQPVVDRVRNTPPNVRSGKLLLDEIDSALAKRGDSSPADSRLRLRLKNMPWPAVVCFLGAKLASALEYAHRQKVLHRDIKPANVLLTSEGQPLVADFNVSFGAEVEGATPAAFFGGSLAYMSPEQMQACDPTHPKAPEELDGRSDVYSLGILLWELLTGSRPFIDEAVTGSWTSTLKDLTKRRYAGIPAESLGHLPEDCPAGLKSTLERALRPDPQDRTASAGEFSRQLELCLQPQVQSMLQGTAQGWRSWIVRHPKTSLIAAGVIPNAITTILNVTYNVYQIVHKLNVNIQELFMNQLLAGVNTLFYGLGVALALYIARPVVRALTALSKDSLTAEERQLLPAARHAALALGTRIAQLAFVEWLASGFVIPLWLRFGTPAGAELDFQSAAHFFVSQLLFGLVAATLTFFLLSFVCSNVIVPWMLRGQTTDLADLQPVADLSRKTWVAFGLASGAPLVAFTLLAFVVDAAAFAAFRAVGIHGLISLGLCMLLTRRIHTDLKYISLAISPEGEGLGLLTDTSSFWSGSR